MSNRIAILGIALSLAAVACTQETEQTRSTLSQREKDSILAGSQIPGAKAVKRAMTTADSAAARQARIDSAQQNP
jgi:hypothetical protein